MRSIIKRMSGKLKIKVYFFAVLLFVAFLLGIDLYKAHRVVVDRDVTILGKLAAANKSPAVVSVVSSMDEGLSKPATLDEYPMTFEQVDEMVWRALELDTSEQSITKIIKTSDWVLVKLNFVNSPLYDFDGKREKDRFHSHGHERWGDNTDARVVKSVVGYLIEMVGPKRISLVEHTTWTKEEVETLKDVKSHHKGVYDVNAWTTRWKEFGNLSYKEMVDEFNESQDRTVVDCINLNADEYRFVPVPGEAYQRVRVKFRSGKFGYSVPVPGTGKPHDGYYIPACILDADKMVNIPAMKMNIGGGTLIFKNYVGVLASIPYGDGISKGRMDRYGFEHGMIDMFSYQPTVYSVVGGFYGSEKDWPTNTDNVHHNVVIAGGNPVATEATTLRIMGVNPMDVEGMHLANLKGFGSFEEGDITVVGTPVCEVRRDFVKHSGYSPIGFQNYLMNGPHKATDLEKDLLGGETIITPKKGDINAGKKWWVYKHPWCFPEAYVSLDECEEITSDLTNTITYAYVCVESPVEQSASFRFGYDDGAKVWFNGEVIFTDDGPHEYEIREKDISVTMNEGLNHLLIKLKNRVGTAGFMSSLEDESGSSLFDMKVIIPAEKGMLEKTGV
ncbi:DUF362 domain-containing protein [Candidatus Latescibacterota bacterium]